MTTKTEELTPAQKGAITRAANKAAREAAVINPKLDAENVHDVIEEVADQIDEFADSEFIQVTASQVTPKFPARVRNVIYTVGIYLGFAATAAQLVAGFTTGEAQLYATSAGTLALSLTNLLAKLNLSKTADDLTAEKAVG